MNEEFGTDLQEKEEVKVKRPKMYNVVLLNDDFTPFDFVIEVLVKIFGKNFQEAESITMNIHHNDKGICGTFPKAIAEMKCKKANNHAKASGYPLKSIVEVA